MNFVKVTSSASVIAGSFVSPKEELINVNSITNVKKVIDGKLTYYIVVTSGASSYLEKSEAKKIFDIIGVSL